MEEEEVIARTSPETCSGPVKSATMGRVMSTLLETKPKKLGDAISRLTSPPKIAPIASSVEQSLWFLHNYIAEVAQKDEHLDQFFVPIIQHISKGRGLKQENQSMLLLIWLFQNDVLFQAIIKNFAGIILRRDDRHIALGWCIIGRALIEIENADNKLDTNGLREKYDVMLEFFCSSINHLISIICNGSKMEEGFELPTRLAVTAADFILSLTVALNKKDLAPKNITKKHKLSSSNTKRHSDTLIQVTTGDKHETALSPASKLSSAMKLKLLLWNNLDELIVLVKKITDWNRKSRALHAKGSERICDWLQEMKQHYQCFQYEADLQMPRTGSLLLSSCWKHYGMLLHLEDYKFSQQYKELLEQFLSGIQFYAEDRSEEIDTKKDSKSDTVNFFINCLLLLLGRLSHQQFGNAIMEFGSRISQVVLSQLQCTDEEVIDGSINIFKAVIFKTNHILSESSIGEVRDMDDVLPILLNLLYEQDAAAKAVVKLLAEYFSVCLDTKCLVGVLKCKESGNVQWRRNAVDFIGNLINISSRSTNRLPQRTWQDVADYLLECLKDEDQILQNQAINLISIIDPPLVFPALVGLSYSMDERVQLSARSALLALLINNKQEPEILCMLLDSLSNLCKNPDSCGSNGGRELSTLDANGLLKLLPDWAKHVTDWSIIAGPLIDKMLAEPSNAIIVRFLSHMSEYLAEAADLIFHRLILYMREQKGTDSLGANCDPMEKEHLLFSRLCPLLIIRLLPLNVFDDTSSTFVYGDLSSKFSLDEGVHIGTECISTFLITRSLSTAEFEDVRKLAAELCGRIHPKFLIPIMSCILESAAYSTDVLKIKVCLFSFCTSLMVRGGDTYRHPDVFRIRKTMHDILSWTSVDNDEISKAQHGCIDCLALMLCTELQASESSKVVNAAGLAGNSDLSGDASILAYVMNQLTDDGSSEATTRLPFRLCMANVVISACQKISNSGKKSFIKNILPHIILSLRVMMDAEMRAACLQILFSMTYHLKSLIYPYSKDLLSVALKSLKEGSEKEKLGGAKLLASLMASDEDVVERISSGLLEAKPLLENLSSTHPSSDVRQMCRQLLLCLTSSQ